MLEELRAIAVDSAVNVVWRWQASVSNEVRRSARFLDARVFD